MFNQVQILKYFPTILQKKIEQILSINELSLNLLEEIRVRTNKPVILKLGQTEKIIDHTITSDEILEILQHICDNSIYSYQNQICSGYITLPGGHRVGITGNVVIKDGKVINISYISSLNFRIAKQILDCSNSLLRYILNIEENSIYNTIIVSPPGAGKTTILRDFIRKISNGMEQIKFNGINVGVIDERGEIAAMYKGIPQNDIGIRTDVLDNVSKPIGINMMIRSMAPKVIAVDEIGSKEDIEAINNAVCCGVKGIFTAHGSCIEDLKLNPSLKELMDNNLFERIIFLSNKGTKGKIERVYGFNKINKEYEIL